MVGERWKKLPDDQRKYYQELAQEDMKRQKQAMEEYYAKQQALKEGRKPVEVSHAMGIPAGMYAKPVQSPSKGAAVPHGIQKTSV
jgi:TRAP-type C4-dicarboxylate transport system substrate-binding protein